ncbi:hypothetical protein ACHAXT_007762 [Thalassiosira profunda]
MGASASKIKFRESLTSLTTRDVSPSDTEFWDELWKIPSSSEEVFELLTPANARRLRDDRFENLATLFTQATAQLCQIVETPYTIYFDQALNCVRVLTRVVPFLLEKGDLGEGDPNVELLCWGEAPEEEENAPATVGGDATKLMSPKGKDVTVVGSQEEGEATEVEIKLDSPQRSDKENENAGPLPRLAKQISDSKRSAKLPKRGEMSPRGAEETSDSDSDESDTLASDMGSPAKDPEEDGRGTEDDDDNEPLALLVVHAAMHMLFLPQFTCEFYEEDGTGRDYLLDDSDSEDDEVALAEEESRQLDREGQAEAGLGRPQRIKKGVRLAPRPAGIVWAPGVGFTTDGKCLVGATEARGPKLHPDLAYTRKYDKNRIEVLRLLLAACSDPLFSPADEYNPLASRWMSVAVAADSPNAPCLFYSLLNTVLGYNPSGSGLVGGVSSIGGDAHVKLVELSAQVLCVLLDCGLSGDPVPYEDRKGEPVATLDAAYTPGFNIFRTMLARIDNGRDLNTLYRGFVRLLRNMFESKSSLLPSSQARLECHQELLILLWKTLEENPLFLDFILTRCDVCELVVPICYLMYVSRREEAQVGLIHICTFILLKLSGERSFGVSLNRPFRTKLPCDLPLFSGSHADLVSITLHKIIVNGSYRLVPLYSCFLTIVCNFSPYWRSMSLVASVKLVNLFELFSSPKFLYSSEKAYKHLALLLEVFNNIIQYQYNGNQHLVYAIVRRKDAFGRLASLTLPKAIYQCEKAFPSHDKPEYDADVEEQVAAMSVQEHDETGKPVQVDTKPKKMLAGRFAPTDAWMAELKASLPLETVNRLLQHLVPVVDDMCERKNGVVDELEILEVFKDITMVGLLPVPHAIVIRKYQPNQYTSIWFTAFMWGVIYLRSQKPPMFDGECIQLFQVSSEEK